MAVQETEPKYVADVVAFEEDGRYSREVLSVTAPVGADIDIGTALASSDGTNYVSATGIGVDGVTAATNAAVLLEKLTAGTTAKVLCLVRHATVKRQGLAFDAGLTVQPAIEALLDGQGIIIRDGV